MFNKFIASLCLFTMTFSLVSCKQSQVTETLDLILIAADAALTVLPASEQTLITPYLKDITAAVDFTTTELSSKDSGAVKAAKITAEFAAIAKPQVPAGTASTVVAAIDAVATAVSGFLATLQTTSAQFFTTSKGVNAFFTSDDKSIKVSKKDLAKVEKHNAEVKAKLGKK